MKVNSYNIFSLVLFNIQILFQDCIMVLVIKHPESKFKAANIQSFCGKMDTMKFYPGAGIVFRLFFQGDRRQNSFFPFTVFLFQLLKNLLFFFF